jgi:hypothetical protein
VPDVYLEVTKAPTPILENLMTALEAEARRRIASGEYFGHIAYLSLVARNAASAG